ncbi:RPA1B [Scenedesmus sp. PABB004]|nr:RPA1B [Scenedesmus sp. PABB004]
MAAALTPRVLEAAKEGGCEPATLRVRSISKLPNGKAYACVVTDGVTNMKGRIVSAANRALAEGSLALCDGDVVRTDNYSCSSINDEHLLMISGLSVIASSGGGGGADADTKPDQLPSTPLHAGAAVKAEPGGDATPAAKRPALTPGPTPSPSEEVKGTPAFTPAAGGRVGSGPLPTPPSFTPAASRLGGAGGAATPGGGAPAGSPLPVVASKAGVQPIAALNPYDTQWCIKAVVVRKAPPRSFAGRGGAPNKVFNVELADAQGGQVQATFWREAADRYLDVLQEGKTYYFSKFTVKPANKQYATVKNDYEIHLDARTEITEAADQGGIIVSHVLDLVPIDKLPRHVGRKATVDVLGVVTACGALGTIKRKADATEVPRRDVTLADATARSVVLTLWADNATRAELDGCEGSLMQVTCVRVGDYNGCSISAVTRSEVTINPTSPEAEALRAWWDTEGRGAAITPIGQAGAAGGGAGGRGSRLQFLDDVAAEEAAMPSPDAKPTYHDVIATVLQVRDDTTMYYLANPENNKKVEPRDGRYWCEGDARYVDAAQHRYVLQAKVADATREMYVSMFNDQGAALLGCSADELAAKQAGDEAGFKRAVGGAKWSEWAMTLTARAREYNGERRMRYTVTRMAPVDYAAEGHRLLALIQARGGA